MNYKASFRCNMLTIIWATSWENLFLAYVNNKGADQPAHQHSLISAFAVHCLDSIIPLVSISKISSLYLASVAEQAGLSHTWLHIPKTGFLATRLIWSKVFRQTVLGKQCRTKSDLGLHYLPFRLYHSGTLLYGKKPSFLNFRMITANVSGTRILMIFRIYMCI